MSNQEFRPGGFQILPPVVKNILIISVLMFVIQYILQIRMNLDLTDYLGLHYFSAPLFRPYQFVTYIFMHGGIAHLFFNMFAVWMFGAALENIWGSKRFLIFYLVTGMGAALIQYVVYYFEITPVLNVVANLQQNPGDDSLNAFFNSKLFAGSLTREAYDHFISFADRYNAVLTESPSLAASLANDYLQTYRADFLNAHTVVGASGSLFGILLGFAMLFPNTYLNIYFFIPIKAKYFVMLYGGLEIYSAIKNDPTDNVAHFAHLGGMLFGFIMIKIWQRNRSNFY
jgi:membrane associated rhomboid family serine protease